MLFVERRTAEQLLHFVYVRKVKRSIAEHDGSKARTWLSVLSVVLSLKSLLRVPR